jgi:xanthine dehydrogenase accessory factor
VAATFDKLRAESVEEDKIKTIHAPIGLDIKARTPAEIAISILAEIIQEKNRRYLSFVSRELLNVREKGVLCIITEKKGSAPRGAGSMMFVGENGTIDTIGGGAIEMAAIKDAKNITKAVEKEYLLDSSESAQLGMICGGSNKVLFVPIN